MAVISSYTVGNEKHVFGKQGWCVSHLGDILKGSCINTNWTFPINDQHMSSYKIYLNWIIYVMITDKTESEYSYSSLLNIIF